MLLQRDVARLRVARLMERAHHIGTPSDPTQGRYRMAKTLSQVVSAGLGARTVSTRPR
jgi:hypothetical protein